MGGRESEGIKKRIGGEADGDVCRRSEALVARLPRMPSDSGRLMTGGGGRSESRRAGGTLRTGAPLSLGTDRPRPPPEGAASDPIHSLVGPSVRGEARAAVRQPND